MYYEKQRGNMCRLHSLNAYFGYKKLDETTFFNYCDNYDKLIKGLNSRDMDGFAECRCIINYIIDIIDKKYTLTIPINLFKNSREYVNIDRYNKLLPLINYYFEFNKTHVWLNKRDNNKWWKIDSISGISLIDPKFKNNGYIIVFDNNLLVEEIDYYRMLLKNDNQIKEIYWCNLFHSVKFLDKNITLLNKINIELKIIISLYRKTNQINNDSLIKLKNLICI